MLDEAIFTAGDLMTRNVAVMHSEKSLLEVINLMVQRHISGLPVVDNATAIVGMISEGDLLRWHEVYSERQARWLDLLADGFEVAPEFLEELQKEHCKVKVVMSPAAVITVTEETPAREIARLMNTKHISEFRWFRMENWSALWHAPTLCVPLPRSWGKILPPRLSSG